MTRYYGTAAPAPLPKLAALASTTWCDEAGCPATQCTHCKSEDELKMNTTQHTQTGDLDLARHLMTEDSFLDGHTGLDACEYIDEAPPSEPGTASIHLNGEVIDSLLAARGWKRGDNGAWYAPDGDSMHWHRDEALTLALTAEAC